MMIILLAELNVDYMDQPTDMDWGFMTFYKTCEQIGFIKFFV